MKIIIFSFTCAVIVIANPLGVNSSELNSKIVDGSLAENEEYKYVASLQLDGKHICSSGMFQEGYLLTSGECAWYIEYGMKHKYQDGTAVIGDLNLKEGKRIQILGVEYDHRFCISKLEHWNKQHNLGVVKLAKDFDYTHLQIAYLYKKFIDLRANKHLTKTCGWGSVTNSNEGYKLNQAEYVDNLHCMKVKVYSRHICTSALLIGDHNRFMMCGQGKMLNQTTALGDVGSPLTSIIMINGKPKNCIIGVTLRNMHIKKGIFLRFIATSQEANISIAKMKRMLDEQTA